MATYSAQCTAVGSFGYANYFKLYVVLTETDISVSGNSSKVNYTVYCQSSGSGSINANHLKYFNINGSDIINKTENVNVSSPNAYIAIASGTTGAIAHNSDGTKSISFSAQIKASSYGVSASLSDTFTLTKINRYPTFTTNPSITARTINTITFNWGAVDIASDIYYSLNNSTWTKVTSASTVISNLTPNTAYTVYVQARNQAATTLTTTKTCTSTTYDIAKINTVSNFEHGSSTTVNITNPGSISSLSLVMKISNTQILSRTASTGNNTITLSDTELDNLYKLYGSGSSLTATFIVSGGGYTNSKTCTITLKGNQKTMKINKSGTWKRGRTWINVNGTWKPAVVWKNINGTWKRSI